MATQSDSDPLKEPKKATGTAPTTHITVQNGGPLPPDFNKFFKGFPFVNVPQGNVVYQGHPGNVTVTNITASGDPQTVSNNAAPMGGAATQGPQDSGFPKDFGKIFERAFPNGESGVRTQVIEGLHRKKQVNNKFRIRNSDFHCLAVGNEGPVNMKSTSTTYKENASKNTVNVEGGNIVQGNFGGEADYDNKDTNLTASDGGVRSKKARGSGKFTSMDELGHPFSPEQYLVKVLDTGITADELAALLVNRYSVEELAYSIPTAKSKRDLMIETLLKMAKI